MSSIEAYQYPADMGHAAECSMNFLGEDTQRRCRNSASTATRNQTIHNVPAGSFSRQARLGVKGVGA